MVDRLDRQSRPDEGPPRAAALRCHGASEQPSIVFHSLLNASRAATKSVHVASATAACSRSGAVPPGIGGASFRTEP